MCPRASALGINMPTLGFSTVSRPGSDVCLFLKLRPSCEGNTNNLRPCMEIYKQHISSKP